MTDKADLKTDTQTDALVGTLAAIQQAGLGTMAGMSSAWLETVSDMGAEVMSFLAERVKQDVDTQHKILHCKNPAELQELQGHFVKKAMEQYHAETGKLVEMGSDSLAPIVNPMRM